MCGSTGFDEQRRNEETGQVRTPYGETYWGEREPAVGEFGIEYDLPDPGQPGTGSGPRHVPHALPWLEIIFTGITVVMVAVVLLNFESVTTALFQLLLPLLYNITLLVLVLGLILLGIVLLRRPPRNRW